MTEIVKLFEQTSRLHFPGNSAKNSRGCRRTSALVECGMRNVGFSESWRQPFIKPLYCARQTKSLQNCHTYLDLCYMIHMKQPRIFMPPGR